MIATDLRLGIEESRLASHYRYHVIMNAAERETRAARYLKVVCWSDKEGCFVGRCPELFHGGCHGDDEAKVYRELSLATEEWVAILDFERLRLPPKAEVRRRNLRKA
jgi:predicted RNase H-like HicB family nuclease